MRKWGIVISKNGWGYVGYAIIKANNVDKIGKKTLLADSVEIEFDEEITQPVFHDEVK